MRDADNVAAVGAVRPDYMGFIFVPSSPRFVGESLSPDAIMLPSQVKRIGVFQNAPLESVLERIAQFALHGVQLHGDENLAYMRSLREASPSILILKAVRVTAAHDIAQITDDAGIPDLFVLDSAHGGSSTSFEWSWLSRYTASVPYLLAGGIGLAELDSVERLAEQHPLLHGIDVNSRVEHAPGIKDIKRIQEIAMRLGV
jgi:phosphoribosylanthranilate isomerase